MASASLWPSVSWVESGASPAADVVGRPASATAPLFSATALSTAIASSIASSTKSSITSSTKSVVSSAIEFSFKLIVVVNENTFAQSVGQ